MLEFDIILGKSEREDFLKFGDSEHVALHARSGAGKTSSFTIRPASHGLVRSWSWM